MAMDPQRAAALKAAKWLVTKGRGDEAVALLASWAASGANDEDGQELMAEALRVNPGAPIARQAFERMERVPGDHRILDAAIVFWTPEKVEEITKQIPRPNFIRAQVGFNNNVKYKSHVYHIQTEDSGLDRPHLITHLFADGGRIIKSHKRSYAEHVTRDDIVPFVRQLMKAQHMEMALMLREGIFDEVIAGRAIGGLENMEHAPRTDVKKLGQRTEDGTAAPPPVAAPVPPAPPSAAISGSAPTPRYYAPFRLHVERTAGGDPAAYEPTSDTTLIGTAGEVKLPRDVFCHPREARLSFRDGRLWLTDLPDGNGVFLRISHLTELEPGDEFIVGDHLLRVEHNPEKYDDGPGPGPTYFYSSPKWSSAFRVSQIFEGGRLGSCCLARGNYLQIGAEQGDLILARDPLVSAIHCNLEEQAGTIILTDMQSRTGVFVRVKGEQEVLDGDEILVGRTRLRVQFLETNAA